MALNMVNMLRFGLRHSNQLKAVSHLMHMRPSMISQFHLNRMHFVSKLKDDNSESDIDTDADADSEVRFDYAVDGSQLGRKKRKRRFEIGPHEPLQVRFHSKLPKNAVVGSRSSESQESEIEVESDDEDEDATDPILKWVVIFLMMCVISVMSIVMVYRDKIPMTDAEIDALHPNPIDDKTRERKKEYVRIVNLLRHLSEANIALTDDEIKAGQNSKQHRIVIDKHLSESDKSEHEIALQKAREAVQKLKESQKSARKKRKEEKKAAKAAAKAEKEATDPRNQYFIDGKWRAMPRYHDMNPMELKQIHIRELSKLLSSVSLIKSQIMPPFDYLNFGSAENYKEIWLWNEHFLEDMRLVLLFRSDDISADHLNLAVLTMGYKQYWLRPVVNDSDGMNDLSQWTVDIRPMERVRIWSRFKDLSKNLRKKYYFKVDPIDYSIYAQQFVDTHFFRFALSKEHYKQVKHELFANEYDDDFTTDDMSELQTSEILTDSWGQVHVAKQDKTM